MMRSLVSRILFEKRWFILGWSVAFGVLGTLIMMFYPSFSQGGGFDEVAKTLPDGLQGFIGDPAIFASLDGFIALQVFDVRMSLMMIIMTMILAIGLTVKQEESGELRTLLAAPLSRTRTAIESLSAATIIIGILTLATIIGVYVGLASLGESAPHSLIWQLFALTWLFGMVAFCVPFGLGIATGNRAITLTVGLFVALGSYILTTFSRGVEWLRDWEHLSLIHYYDTGALREGTFSALNIWVYVLVASCIIVGSILAFRKRNIS